MHRFILAGVIAAAAALTVASPAAASDKTDATAVVTRFFTGTDMAASTRLCAPDAVVIDDFPPHAWHGPDACGHWLRDYLAWSKARGMTPGPLTLGTMRHVEVTGTRAYVVVPAKITYDVKGKSITHGATVTAALKKAGGKWLLTGWAWGND